MTAKHRNLSIALAIAVLAALNIWRWWPASAPPPDNVGHALGAFDIDDFSVKASPADSLLPLSRNIFFPKKVVTAKRPVVKAAPTVIQIIPQKSPEELARESAQAEFAQIRCVGISVRNERIHAYLINAGESLLVSNGDKVGSRFVVEKIMSDGVSLRDPVTGVGGVITISGK